MSQKTNVTLAFRQHNVIVHGLTMGDRITYRILSKGGVTFTGLKIGALIAQGFDYAGLNHDFVAAVATASAANGGVLPDDFIPRGWQTVDNDDPSVEHNEAADAFVNAVAVGGGTAIEKYRSKGYFIGLVMAAVNNLLRGEDGVLFANWSDSVFEGVG